MRTEDRFEILAARARVETPPGVDVAGRVIRNPHRRTRPPRPDYGEAFDVAGCAFFSSSRPCHGTGNRCLLHVG